MTNPRKEALMIWKNNPSDKEFKVMVTKILTDLRMNKEWMNKVRISKDTENVSKQKS